MSRKQWTREQQLLVGHALQAEHLGGGSPYGAISAIKAGRWSHQDALVAHFEKATQSAQSTSEFSVALTRIQEAYLAGVASRSIAMMPGLLMMPSLTRLYVNQIAVTVAGDVIAEGAAIPVLRGGSWQQYFLGQSGLRKTGSIIVVTKELAESSSSEAATAIADTAARSDAASLDTYALAPDGAASIFAGVPMANPSGSSAAAVEADTLELARIHPSSHLPGLRWLTTPRACRAMMALRTSGVRTFPELTLQGGRLHGFDVDLSPALQFAGSPTQDCLALVDPSRIFWMSDMRPVFRTSTEAAVEMSDAPAHKSTATATGANMISLFQTSSVGILSTIHFDYLVGPGAITAMRSAI